MLVEISLSFDENNFVISNFVRCFYARQHAVLCAFYSYRRSVRLPVRLSVTLRAVRLCQNDAS